MSLLPGVPDGFAYFIDCWTYVERQHGKNQDILLRIIDSLSSDELELLSQNKKKAILTNTFVKIKLSEPERLIRFDDSWYGMYAGRPDIILREPTKSFNCFINRMDSVRQSWLYQLVRRKLFDHGYVSFNMDISRRPLRPTDTPMDIFEDQFKTCCAIFSEEHNILKNMVPYKNFEIDVLSQVIIDSKFSIILETYHDSNDFITFSEKIFRCLKLPRPWVVHAQQGAVAYLRNLGFDVLDDVVDHSYDDIDFSIDRQVAILDQCEILMDLDINLHRARLEQAAVHNSELLDQFYLRWKDDIDRRFAQAFALLK